MAVLRALGYFFEEALTSLWRSRLVNALSIGTMAVSLFVLGAFLAVAANLSQVVTRWTEKVQVTFYLRDGVSAEARDALARRIGAHPAVAAVAPVDREEALQRFRALFRDLASLPDELGANPFPASLEVSLRPERQTPQEVRALADAFVTAPEVEEAQYDLLWIQRLATAVRLVRLLGAFLGGILVLAGVFTIANVIRLTIYARQDELDIMRLVGATPAYVKGPFVVEGMLQGGLGGLLAVGLLWVAFQVVARDAIAGSELLAGASLTLPGAIGLSVVLGGMAVGVVGSLVSIGRLRL